MSRNTFLNESLISKRSEQAKRDIENLNAELQQLIEAGQNRSNINIYVPNSGLLKKHNEKPVTVEPTPKTTNQVRNFIKKTELHPNVTISKQTPPIKVKSPEQKPKGYNVEETREFMRKQKENRLNSLKKDLKSSEQNVQERKLKLKELQEKSLKILSNNVKCTRSRSKSKEKTSNVDISCDKLSKSEVFHTKPVEINNFPSTSTIQPSISPKNNNLDINLHSNITVRKKSPRSTNSDFLNPILIVSEEIDINLAAAKIQAAFRSFKERKLLKKQEESNLVKAIEEKKRKVPKWLETKIASAPYNVVETFKRKLAFAANIPSNNELPKQQIKNTEIIESRQEINLKDSVKNSQNKDLKSFLSHKCLDLDLKKVDELNLTSKNRKENIETDSDTSKNIPDLSSESFSNQTDSNEYSLDINSKRLKELKLRTKNISVRENQQLNKTLHPDFVKITRNVGKLPRSLIETFQGKENVKSLPRNSEINSAVHLNCSNNLFNTDKISEMLLLTKLNSDLDESIPENLDKISREWKSDISDNAISPSIKSSNQESKQQQIKLNSSDTEIEICLNIFNENALGNVEKSSGSTELNLATSRESDSQVNSLENLIMSKLQEEGAFLMDERIKSDAVIDDSSFSEIFESDLVSENKDVILSSTAIGAKVLEIRKSEDQKENVLPLKIGETTTATVSSNQINVKFQAELHLLNDFNQSLFNLVGIEQSLHKLQGQNQHIKTIYQNQNTQTSFQSNSQKKNSSDFDTNILLNSSTVSSVDCSFLNGSIFDKFDQISNNIKEESLLNDTQMSKNNDNSIMEAENDITFQENVKTFPISQETLSLQHFEQLIKDEDARRDYLKTIYKIRKGVLLDRTKVDLSMLEIQKKHLKETGQLTEASVIRKKQRGILIKLQHEKYEMQRLVQMQKAASKERKNILKQQQNVIKAQLTINNPATIAKIKKNQQMSRRSSGPLKVFAPISQQNDRRSDGSVASRCSSSIAEELIVTTSYHTDSVRLSDASDNQTVNSITSVTQETSRKTTISTQQRRNNDNRESESNGVIISEVSDDITANNADNSFRSCHDEQQMAPHRDRDDLRGNYGGDAIDCAGNTALDLYSIENMQGMAMVENQTEINKRVLLMREDALQKRRQAAEELLERLQRLLEEEKKVAELEMAATTVITHLPHQQQQQQQQQNKQFTSQTQQQLNILWTTSNNNMTGKETCQENVIRGTSTARTGNTVKTNTSVPGEVVSKSKSSQSDNSVKTNSSVLDEALNNTNSARCGNSVKTNTSVPDEVLNDTNSLLSENSVKSNVLVPDEVLNNTNSSRCGNSVKTNTSVPDEVLNDTNSLLSENSVKSNVLVPDEVLNEIDSSRSGNSVKTNTSVLDEVLNDTNPLLSENSVKSNVLVPDEVLNEIDSSRSDNSVKTNTSVPDEVLNKSNASQNDNSVKSNNSVSDDVLNKTNSSRNDNSVKSNNSVPDEVLNKYNTSQNDNSVKSNNSVPDEVLNKTNSSRSDNSVKTSTSVVPDEVHDKTNTSSRNKTNSCRTDNSVKTNISANIEVFSNTNTSLLNKTTSARNANSVKSINSVQDEVLDNTLDTARTDNIVRSNTSPIDEVLGNTNPITSDKSARGSVTEDEVLINKTGSMKSDKHVNVSTSLPEDVFNTAMCIGSATSCKEGSIENEVLIQTIRGSTSLEDEVFNKTISTRSDNSGKVSQVEDEVVIKTGSSRSGNSAQTSNSLQDEVFNKTISMRSIKASVEDDEVPIKTSDIGNVKASNSMFLEVLNKTISMGSDNSGRVSQVEDEVVLKTGSSRSGNSAQTSTSLKHEVFNKTISKRSDNSSKVSQVEDEVVIKTGSSRSGNITQTSTSLKHEVFNKTISKRSDNSGKVRQVEDEVVIKTGSSRSGNIAQTSTSLQDEVLNKTISKRSDNSGKVSQVEDELVMKTGSSRSGNSAQTSTSLQDEVLNKIISMRSIKASVEDDKVPIKTSDIESVKTSNSLLVEVFNSSNEVQSDYSDNNDKLSITSEEHHLKLSDKYSSDSYSCEFDTDNMDDDEVSLKTVRSSEVGDDLNILKSQSTLNEIMLNISIISEELSEIYRISSGNSKLNIADDGQLIECLSHDSSEELISNNNGVNQSNQQKSVMLVKKEMPLKKSPQTDQNSDLLPKDFNFEEAEAIEQNIRKIEKEIEELQSKSLNAVNASVNMINFVEFIEKHQDGNEDKSVTENGGETTVSNNLITDSQFQYANVCTERTLEEGPEKIVMEDISSSKISEIFENLSSIDPIDISEDQTSEISENGASSLIEAEINVISIINTDGFKSTNNSLEEHKTFDFTIKEDAEEFDKLSQGSLNTTNEDYKSVNTPETFDFNDSPPELLSLKTPDIIESINRNNEDIESSSKMPEILENLTKNHSSSPSHSSQPSLDDQILSNNEQDELSEDFDEVSIDLPSSEVQAAIATEDVLNTVRMCTEHLQTNDKSSLDDSADNPLNSTYVIHGRESDEVSFAPDMSPGSSLNDSVGDATVLNDSNKENEIPIARMSNDERISSIFGGSGSKYSTRYDKDSSSGNSSSSDEQLVEPEGVFDVKKRVSEIMADAKLKTDRSARIHDIYTTAYDVNIADKNSDIVSDLEVSPKLVDVKAEELELLKKQWAIEQEIKQLEEQQLSEQREQPPYQYLREIPNKPPPPYTPPINQLSLVTTPSVIPTSVTQLSNVLPLISVHLYTKHIEQQQNPAQSADCANELLDSLSELNTTDVNELLFDMCQELAQEHYDQFKSLTGDCARFNESLVSLKKPLDRDGLCGYLREKLVDLFGFDENVSVKESSVMKWSRKKRDHVDEVLVRELQTDECNWTNFEEDELIVTDQLVNDLTEVLLEEVLDELKDWWIAKSS